MTPRFALVTLVCNGSRFGSHHYMGLRTYDFVHQANQLARSVASSHIEKVVLTSGLDVQSIQGLTRFWSVVQVHPKQLLENAVKPIYTSPVTTGARVRWPTSGIVQRRTDCACTSLRFFAWNLIQYERILVSDSDMCLYQDPLEWLNWQYRLGRHFVAKREIANRGYYGINDGLAMIKPSVDVFYILVNLARTQSQTPYTNGVQDVTESVYGSQSDFPPLPSHLSIKWGSCDHPLAHPKNWYVERNLTMQESMMAPSQHVPIPTNDSES